MLNLIALFIFLSSFTEWLSSTEKEANFEVLEPSKLDDLLSNLYASLQTTKGNDYSNCWNLCRPQQASDKLSLSKTNKYYERQGFHEVKSSSDWPYKANEKRWQGNFTEQRDNKPQ